MMTLKFADAIATLTDSLVAQRAAIADCHCTADTRQSCPAYIAYTAAAAETDACRARLRAVFPADQFQAIQTTATTRAMDAAA